MWMRGIRTNCLMKVHFARHELHHVEQELIMLQLERSLEQG